MFTKSLSGLLVGIAAVSAQTQKVPNAPPPPAIFKSCVKMTEAFGTHVRFTPQEHIQILLNERKAKEAQRFPYSDWEAAAESIDWFDGPKPVSLAYVKSHMPRAMLLTLRFPVDQHPHVVLADLERLLKAEREYDESTKLADEGRAYLTELMLKYGIGPAAVFDGDMGGATPQSNCEKWQ